MSVHKLETRGSHCKRYENPAAKRKIKKAASKARRRKFKILGENSTGKLKELTKGWYI